MEVESEKVVNRQHTSLTKAKNNGIMITSNTEGWLHFEQYG